ELFATARQEPVSHWCGSLMLAKPSLSEHVRYGSLRLAKPP
ncbi:hypothetical protein L195_g062845, partial [Trifolium pratense]